MSSSRVFTRSFFFFSRPPRLFQAIPYNWNCIDFCINVLGPYIAKFQKCSSFHALICLRSKKSTHGDPAIKGMAILERNVQWDFIGSTRSSNPYLLNISHACFYSSLNFLAFEMLLHVPSWLNYPLWPKALWFLWHVLNYFTFMRHACVDPEYTSYTDIFQRLDHLIIGHVPVLSYTHSTLMTWNGTKKKAKGRKVEQKQNRVSGWH